MRTEKKSESNSLFRSFFGRCFREDGGVFGSSVQVPSCVGFQFLEKIPLALEIGRAWSLKRK